MDKTDGNHYITTSNLQWSKNTRTASPSRKSVTNQSAFDSCNAMKTADMAHAETIKRLGEFARGVWWGLYVTSSFETWWFTIKQGNHQIWRISEDFIFLTVGFTCFGALRWGSSYFVMVPQDREPSATYRIWLGSMEVINNSYSIAIRRKFRSQSSDNMDR